MKKESKILITTLFLILKMLAVKPASLFFF